MTIPILTRGACIGQLQVRREGLYTVFETALPPREGLHRLYLLNAHGESAALGLLEPRPEGLFLRRRYSRAALAALPKAWDHAALDPSESAPAAPPPPQHDPDLTPDPAPAPPASPLATPISPTDPPLSPAPAPPPSSVSQDALRWFARPDGSLTAFDGRRSLVALPAALRHEAPGARLLRLNGRDYLVFGT